MSGQPTVMDQQPADSQAKSRIAAADAKLKVFLSYSRNDLSVADQLYSALLACGFEPKIDRHGISGGEDWKKRLGGLILEADSVVFLLSPSALESEMCAWEVLETERSGKRLIPVLTSPLQNSVVPDRLKQLNYIYFYPELNVPGSGFGQGLLQLVEALNTDFLWIREHTRLGQRAAEWDEAGRPQSRLLSGEDIVDAKAWLARRPSKAPAASALHLDFLKASEAAEAERTNAELQRLKEIAAAQSAREDALRAAEAAQLQERAAIANAARAQSARAKLQRISYVGLLCGGIVLAGVGWQIYEQKRALDAQKKAAAVERAIAAESISQTSRTLLEAGDTERALQSATEALRLSKVLADKSVNDKDWQREVAVGYLRVGDVLRAAGRLGESLDAYKDAQSLQERILGSEHPDLAQTLSGIASLLLQQGRYLEAEPLQTRALAIREKSIGFTHPYVARSMEDLAEVYVRLARYDEADKQQRKALSVRERILEPNDPEVARSVVALGRLATIRGHFSEAEVLLKRGVAVLTTAWGEKHRDVISARNDLGELHRKQWRVEDAEPLIKETLAIVEGAFGPDHRETATTLINLAGLYEGQSRYADALPLLTRALSVLEKALGGDHPELGMVLNRLAGVYRALGRDGDAEPLLKRGLVILESAVGPDHPDVGGILESIGELFYGKSRFSEAEPLYRRALSIRERALGPAHPDVGTTLDTLAQLFNAQGRHQEAEPLLKRALSIREASLGSTHPYVGATIGNLANFYAQRERYAEAEPLLLRAIDIRSRALGADHPELGQSLDTLAALYLARQSWLQAASYARKSVDIFVRRSLRTFGRPDLEDERHRFWTLIKALERSTSDADGTAPQVMEETFRAAQWIRGSDAAASLAQMAVRQAMSGTALGVLLRERQDLASEWQIREKALTVIRSQEPEKRDAAAEAGAKARLAAIDTRVNDIDRELSKGFPDYASLANPAPLTTAEVQAFLAADEALIFFLDMPEWMKTAEETNIWVVTQTGSRWMSRALGTKGLVDNGVALRCGLDGSLWYSPESAEKCRRVLHIESRTDTSGHDNLPFDLKRAHELYRSLLEPFESMIKDKKLIIVPPSALTSIPFNVLVTEAPTRALPDKVAEYREVAWLGTRHAITVLPSVGSLKALRQFAKASRAKKPFLGIGNPLLDGLQDHPQFGVYYKQQAQLAREKQDCIRQWSEITTNQLLNSHRGGLVNLEFVRGVAPLPETADEVCEVARLLRASGSDVLLGARATETQLKALSDTGALADYKILHFATQGTLPGQMVGSTEPGLILTPPMTSTELDDGFLSASEIAGLKLDADWVILSACNTAGGTDGNTEAFSGIARAFFYAGSRALLAAHWEIYSDAAVKLTTGVFAALNSAPSIGRAEALRRSMRTLIEQGSANEAHPSAWAPFVVVGEGSR